MKNITKTIGFAALVAGLTMVTGAKADIIHYSVTGDTSQIGSDSKDKVTLGAYNGSINLTPNGSSKTGILNSIAWVDNNGGTGDGTLSRSISISFVVGSETLTQNVDVNYVKISRHDGYDELSIEQSSPVDFSWSDGTDDYTLAVYADAITLDYQYQQYGYGQDCQGDNYIYGTFALTSTPCTNTQQSPVPEPTTVFAGALMLLPLGMSAFRIMRKSRTV